MLALRFTSPFVFCPLKYGRMVPLVRVGLYLVNFREFKIGGINKFIENYYKLIEVQDFNEI